jgi:hypothetical protein
MKAVCVDPQYWGNMYPKPSDDVMLEVKKKGLKSSNKCKLISKDARKIKEI